MRYFYSSKALYTIELYKHYVEHVTPILLSTVGKTKKALIFDCDNTLWKGVCGESGAEGITLDAPRLALQRFLVAQQEALQARYDPDVALDLARQERMTIPTETEFDAFCLVEGATPMVALSHEGELRYHPLRALPGSLQSAGRQAASRPPSGPAPAAKSLLAAPLVAPAPAATTVMPAASSKIVRRSSGLLDRICVMLPWAMML